MKTTIKERLQNRKDLKNYRLRHFGKEKKERNDKMIELRKYKGNRCSICGYSEETRILQFHHISEKNFEISSNAHKKKIENLKIEADKCILICPNCHSKIHLKN